MIKTKISIFILALILIFSIGASSVDAARTDSKWNTVGNYIKTTSVTGYNVLINGLNKYLNFGSLSGSSGYGIRDNSGTIECKDSGGSWSACQDGSGSDFFAWIPTGYGVSTSTTLGFLNGFLSTASSTIDSNLIITGNSTTTNATTTNFYNSTAINLSDSLFINSNGGDVGIGTVSPVTKLSIKGSDDKDTGPIITLNGNAINQFESGRIRFAETDVFYQGGFIHFDGSANTFNIGVHDNADKLISSDINAISILRSNGNVGIGTVSPQKDLHIESGVPTIRLSDDNAATDQAVATLIEFYRANNTSRVGFFGMESSSNDLIKLATDYAAGEIAFSTGSSVEAVRIDSAGNVGIGATNPRVPLQIGSFIDVGAEQLEVRGNSVNYVASFEQDFVLGFGVIIDTDGTLVSQPALRIKNTNSELFYVGSNGNIGIGTTSPNSLLNIHSNSPSADDILFRISTSTGVALNSVLTLDEDGDLVISGRLTQGEDDLLDVHATITQAIVNGSFEPITIDVVDIAKGGMAHTAGTASTTIPVTADYDVAFNGMVDKTAGGVQTAQVMLFINDVEHPECYTERTINSNSETGHFGFRCIESLTAGDILVLKARANGDSVQFAIIGTGVTGDPAIFTWTIERLD